MTALVDFVLKHPTITNQIKLSRLIAQQGTEQIRVDQLIKLSRLGIKLN